MIKYTNFFNKLRFFCKEDTIGALLRNLLGAAQIHIHGSTDAFEEVRRLDHGVRVVAADLGDEGRILGACCEGDLAPGGV